VTGSTTAPDTAPAGVVRRRADVVDLFVYVVVLNLATEHVPAILSEGFTLSLLTAVLLKLTLEVVISAKAVVLARLRAATTTPGKVALGVTLWGLAVGSKVVVLWLIDLAFGDAVSLGGFVSVTALVMVLLLSRRGVRWLLREPARAEEV